MADGKSSTVNNVAKLVGEVVIPGGSLLLKGDLGGGALHFVAGTLARVVIGPIGLFAVSANAFTKATTDRSLIDRLQGSEAPSSPSATTATGSTALTEVEGIGPAYAAKLKAAGVATVEELLKEGGTRNGREKLAEATDISPTLILRFVNRADMMRVKGIGSEFSDLLEASGVDTVVELARRNPANLVEKMGEVNEEKKLVRRLPAQTQVENWVEQAKALPRAVSY